MRGGIVSVTLYHSGSGGNYLSNTVASGNSVWALKVGSSNVGMEGASRFYGRSLRCVVPRQRPRTICCSFILQPGGQRVLGCFERPRQLRELLV